MLYVEGREVAVLGGDHLLESAGVRCSLRTNSPFEPASHEHSLCQITSAVIGGRARRQNRL